MKESFSLFLLQLGSFLGLCMGQAFGSIMYNSISVDRMIVDLVLIYKMGKEKNDQISSYLL